MGFKSQKSGAIVWEPPTGDEIKQFQSSIIPGAAEGEIPSHVQNQLSNFIKTTLQGSHRLIKSNEVRSKYLSSIAEKGVQPVDIIVPVYGGLQVVKKCLASIKNRTRWPYRLIIIDDASPDQKTKDWLKENYPDNTSFQNKNKGFSASVNAGIRSGSNPYICILNSDVIVTEGWLTKMVMALEADPRNKIVNPATNNTAMIDVPFQPGLSYLQMNEGLEKLSSHIYPEIMPTGFCYMFYRDLIKYVGYFDEGYDNYGEESDHHMKVVSYVQKGEYTRWRAVLADDTYLFHERGTSFSSLGHQAHMTKRQAGSARFHAIWPQFKHWQRNFDVKKAIGPVRAEIPVDLLNKEHSYNIAFVVHSTGFCGGMSVITDIVNEYNERGINAKVVHIKRSPKQKEPVIGELRSGPIVFEDAQDFLDNFQDKVFDNGIVVAGTNELVPPVAALCRTNSKYQSVLFAQSDDVALAPTEEAKNNLFSAFSHVDHIIAGSKYLADKISTNYEFKVNDWIRPGVDTDLFYPRDRSKGDERPTLLLALMGTYPFKGYKRGVALAKDLTAICERNNTEIRILAYGQITIPECPNVIGLGDISPSRLARLLGTEVDVFCDPSHIHSYGLPALEAIASGVKPIMWDNGGVREYATESNSKIFDNNTSTPILANEIYEFLTSSPQLIKVNQFDQTRKTGVDTFISSLEKTFGLLGDRKKIAIITPHLRKHGGPTTIVHTANVLKKRGHEVNLYTIYPDLNPEVVNESLVPIHINWKDIHPCDILISNSDNEHNDFFVHHPQAKKKVMLKLSHNPRFQKLEDDSLHLNWDAIMTSTDWLVSACEKPRVEEGWTHPSKKAKRIGWFHYGHNIFSCPPTSRKYGSLDTMLNIGFLVHQHPLKGSQESLAILEHIKKKYKEKVNIVGVGEWSKFTKSRPSWVDYMFSPNRQQTAEVMSQLDIWLSSSHSEGLGRMALEAMSSGCAVVMTDTGAEFAKDGENCLVFKHGNIASGVKTIEKLLTDPILFSSLVKEGFATACNYADSTDYINNIEKVLSEIT